eukprot:NODE_181_length_13917_cov_0.838110.p11 type:complete len:166 gc:universal NODE_181_length_13917_cov_0.838110:1097-1594(+)
MEFLNILYREYVGLVWSVLPETEHMVYYYNQIPEIPGSGIVTKYIQSSYQHDPFRVCLEFILLVYTIKYLVQRRKAKHPDRISLSKEEIDELISDWKPESLVPDVEENKVPIISSPLGSKVKIQGNNRNMINLVSINPVGFLGDKKLLDIATDTVTKYAVGNLNL